MRKRTAMNGQVIVFVVLAAVVGWLAYAYFNDPQPLGERFDNAASALEDGEGGNALEALGNRTRGEQLEDDVENAVAPLNPENR
jgi:predicted negative regulator of RcsB-dependent stress response